jgi:DNA-binding NtrC family response regulator
MEMMPNLRERYEDIERRVSLGGSWGNSVEGLFDEVEKGMPLQQRVALYEKSAIEKCLALQGWPRGHTATALGIDRKTVYTKMKAYGLFLPQTG